MRQLLCFLSCCVNDFRMQLEKRCLKDCLSHPRAAWVGRGKRKAGMACFNQGPQSVKGQSGPVTGDRLSPWDNAISHLCRHLPAGALSQISWLVTGCCFSLLDSFRKPAGDVSRLSKNSASPEMQHSSHSLLCSNRRSMMVQ